MAFIDGTAVNVALRRQADFDVDSAGRVPLAQVQVGIPGDCRKGAAIVTSPMITTRMEITMATIGR
jgi:hypothetical protein